MTPAVEPNRPWPARQRLLRWAAWFALANALLLGVAGYRCVQISGWPSEWPARFFLAVMYAGHFITLAMAPWVVSAIVGLIWPNRWAASAAAVTASGLLLLGIVVDGIVFKLYRFHLNGMVWSLIVNGGITEILPLSFNTWTVAALLAVGVFAVEAVLALFVWKWVTAQNRGGKYVLLAAAALILLGQVWHAWADAIHYTPVTKLPRILPACRPLTSKKLFRKLGLASEPTGPELSVKTSGTALKYPLAPVVCDPPPTPLNLVFIVIDGWRFDMLTEAATPNVWRLSQKSICFDRHSSAANATRFGIFTMFYGLYGTYWHAMLGEQRGPVLVHALDQAGYQFGVFASARLTSPEFDRTVFSEIRGRIPLQIPGGSTPGRDREITRRFQEFLDRRDRQKPFFGFLFYDSSHAYDYPADAPAPFQPSCAAVEHLKLNAKFDPVPVRNRFLNATHFVDSLIAAVLARLDQESLLDRTVVVVTGDHGQEFNETGRNFWGHNGNFSRYQAQVPLVLHWPGKPPGVVSYLTSHLDLAPTFLREALRCPLPFDQYSNGQSLFDPAPRVPLLLATWDRFALLSPGRIDVMFNTGHAEHYDEDYRELTTPTPPKLIPPALEGMSRFYAR